MAVRKASGRYVVEFESKGNRVFRRLPPRATKEQAEALETRLRREIIDQRLLGKRPDVTLEFAINAWLAEAVTGRKSETGTRSHAAAVLGIGTTVASLSAGLGRGAQCLAGSGLAAGTINRRLCVLKAVAKFAWRKGWTEENLSAKIQLLPEKGYTRREVTREQVQAIMAEANTPRARALIAFGAYTGMRLGEILKLEPEDVVGGVIHVRDGKTGDRTIPILPELKPHLGELPFTAGWRNIYRGWQSARKRAKVNIRFHDLRHMVATEMANRGKHPIVIADILGHKSLQTTRKYTHPSMEAKRKALGVVVHQNPIRRAKKAA